MKFIGIYLAIINALGLLLMLIDKQRARKQAWRIPEQILMTVAAIGGSLGTLIGMHLFRHKTKHLKFTLGIPAILIVQIALVWWLL
mgnify:CR=1 FL=1